MLNQMPAFQNLRRWLKPLAGSLPPLYLVGGCVRDHLLGRPPRDIDLVCLDAEATARRIAARNGAAFVTLAPRGVLPCYRVVHRQDPDLQADIAPLYRGDLTADLKRRDFTLNAMAITLSADGRPGPVVDPLHGQNDLQRRVIRMAGPGAITDDPLRILRAFRFSAQLDGTIEARTLAAIRSDAPRLAAVSVERIAHEFVSILETPRAAVAIRRLDDLGILEAIVPEIAPMKGCAQNRFHHLDVWDHALLVLENCEGLLNGLEAYFGPEAPAIRANLAPENRLAWLKFAALLHDIGKPPTRSADPATGSVTFYDHPRVGADLTAVIARRLHLSRRTAQYLHTLVDEHRRVFALSAPEVRQRTRLRWLRKVGAEAVPLIIHGLADTLGTLGPASRPERKDLYLAWARETLGAFWQEITPRLDRPCLVSGHDLIDLGLKPGPRMGAVLQQVREAQDCGDIHDREGALALARRLIAAAISPSPRRPSV